MKIKIMQEAKDKLDMYCEFAEGEVSGLFTIDQSGDTFVITDTILFPDQECSGAHTEISNEVASKFILDEIGRGFDVSKYKGHWHTHPTFSTSPSGTDTDMASKWNNGWMLSVITNKKQEYYTRMNVYDPCYFYVEKIPFDVIRSANPMAAAIKAEIEAKVRKPLPKVWAGDSQGYGTYTHCPNCQSWKPKGHLCVVPNNKTTPTFQRQLDSSKDDNELRHFGLAGICIQCGQYAESCDCPPAPHDEDTIVPMSRRERKKFWRRMGFFNK